MTSDTKHPLGIGYILGTSCWLPLRHPLTLILPFLCYAGLSALVEIQVFGGLYDDMFAADTSLAKYGYYLGQNMVAWVLSAWVSLMGFRLLTGGDAHAARNTALTLRHIAPLMVLSIAYLAFVIIGYIALIVPGLYLSVRYWVFPMALLVEDSRYAALRRASDLSEGARLAMMGTVIVAFVAAALLYVALAALLGLVSGLGPMGFFTEGAQTPVLLRVTSDTLIYALFAGVTATLYQRLVVREAPAGTPDLEEVFA